MVVERQSEAELIEDILQCEEENDQALLVRAR